MAVPLPASPSLSASQLATLAAVGEERTAAVGDVLYRVGDATYPFIAIQEGEVAILDAAGNEIIRHGASSFLGELNLLSGQTVFVTAVVLQPLRYIAVDRDVLRGLLFEDGLLSDLVLSTLLQRRAALQRVEGIGIEIVGTPLVGGDAAPDRGRAGEPAAVQLARPVAGRRRRAAGGPPSGRRRAEASVER